MRYYGRYNLYDLFVSEIPLFGFFNALKFKALVAALVLLMRLIHTPTSSVFPFNTPGTPPRP